MIGSFSHNKKIFLPNENSSTDARMKSGTINFKIPKFILINASRSNLLATTSGKLALEIGYINCKKPMDKDEAMEKYPNSVTDKKIETIILSNCTATEPIRVPMINAPELLIIGLSR